MKWLCCILGFCLIVLLGSCAGAPESPEAGPAAPAGDEAAAAGGPEREAEPAPAPKPQPQDDALARMQEFLANGRNKVEQGAISEGITQLVNVLAEGQKLPEAGPQAREVVFAAETELAKIGAALEVEGGTEWLDAGKNQISASAVDVGTSKGLNPSVILTLNVGGGKTLISGAPITFEFVKGGGVLTGFVNTNDYGQANCAVARLDNPNEENIIRASVVYRVGGYAYRFKGLEKDFVYLPPMRKATIMALERSPDQVMGDPVILDAVYNRLKSVAFDFSHYNGVLMGDTFQKVFGGDLREIQNLGLEKGVSYLVMVLNEGQSVNQLEMGGKKYNIYKSQTNATTRIIRISDGKILYSGTVQGVDGQGGSREKAAIDGLRNASQAMADKLAGDLPRIVEILSGGGR